MSYAPRVQAALLPVHSGLSTFPRAAKRKTALKSRGGAAPRCVGTSQLAGPASARFSPGALWQSWLLLVLVRGSCETWEATGLRVRGCSLGLDLCPG